MKVKVKKGKRFIFIALCVLLLASCSSYIQKPMVAQGLNDTNGVTIVSTSASRRVNFVADLKRARYICMEPQPDVREDIAKAFLAAAMAGVKQTGAEQSAEGSAKIANISQLLTAQLNRSISIEYLKASLFALCQQKYGQFARATHVLEHELSSEYTKRKAQSNMSPDSGYEAYDFHKIGRRAQVLALAEIIYGNRTLEQKAAINPSDEMKKLLTQLQEIEQIIDRDNAISETKGNLERKKIKRYDKKTTTLPKKR